MMKSIKILSTIVFILCLIFILYVNRRESEESLPSVHAQLLDRYENADWPQNNQVKQPNVVNKIPRILCLITTNPKNHKTKARAVSETWGKRCDILLFVSSKKEDGLPIIDVECDKDNHDYVWCKNRKGIIEAYKKFTDQYDWFYKADDDTYVVMENLKHLVETHSPEEPIWFGCPLKPPNKGQAIFFSGGAGYVLSREAMNRLVKSFDEPKKYCDTKSQVGQDDVFLGSCLENTGVQYGNELDKRGRPRFFPLAPKAWLNPYSDVYAANDWLRKIGIQNYTMGTDCCSDTSISFHYISAEDMYVYDFLIYSLKVNK